MYRRGATSNLTSRRLDIQPEPSCSVRKESRPRHTAPCIVRMTTYRNSLRLLGYDWRPVRALSAILAWVGRYILRTKDVDFQRAVVLLIKT